MVTIKISAPGASSGVNLFAPDTNTTIGEHLDSLGNPSDIVMAIPTTASNINLTSIGRYLDGSGSLWRMSNGLASDENVELKGYRTGFTEDYILEAGFETYTISPIGGSGPLTHILSSDDVTKTKAASNANALTASPEIFTTDDYDITGTSFDDTMTGASGNDTLIGALGNDDLTGGLGSDSLTGGGGMDNFIYDTTTIADAGTEVDTIIGFETGGIDKIVLSTGLDLDTNGGSVTFDVISFGPIVFGTGISNSDLEFAFVTGVALTAGDFA